MKKESKTYNPNGVCDTEDDETISKSNINCRVVVIYCHVESLENCISIFFFFLFLVVIRMNRTEAMVYSFDIMALRIR